MTGPNTFLVAATRLGGLHGYGPTGATAPLGGAVVGFTKAYNMEQVMREGGKGVTVKAVDFEPSRKTVEPADQLIGEALFDPGVVEVGYFEGQRYTVTLEEIPAKDGQPGMVLEQRHRLRGHRRGGRHHQRHHDRPGGGFERHLLPAGSGGLPGPG